MDMPGQTFRQPGQIQVGVPVTLQCVLALQQFDRKELYQGLGSGFLECFKEFVRQIDFSERACCFMWLEDIKVDVLG